MKLKAALAGLIIMSSANVALAESQGWELVEEKSGVKVFTKVVEGSSLKAFKGVTTVNSSLSSLVALLADTTACEDWMHNCGGMKLVEQVSPTERYSYTINDAPFPVTDRDVVVHSVTSQDPQNLTVTISMDGGKMIERMPLDDDYVRMNSLKGYWQYKPMGSGAVEVTYEAHADPGGNLPSWLANSVVVKTPLNTLKNMPKMLKKDKYQTAQINYITEPGALAAQSIAPAVEAVAPAAEPVAPAVQ